YAYDAAGRRTATTYPSGRTVGWRHDVLGRLSAVVDDAVGETTYTYDPDGLPLQELLPGGASRRWEHDAAGRITQYEDGVAGNGQRPAITSLRYDAASRLDREVRDGESFEYGYDAAGQLVQVSRDGTVSARYGYDSVGNRTRMQDGRAVTESTFDAANQLLSQATGNRTTTYGYDAAGRLVNRAGVGGPLAVSYDAAGQPTEVRRGEGLVERRAYDGDGRLVEVGLNEAHGHELVWDGNAAVSQVLEIRGAGSVLELVYGRERVGAVRGGRGELFGFDVHGSAVRSTGTGGLTESSSYDPFGLPSTGVTAEVSAARLRFGYRGELSLAGVVHLRAREYDPALGRFTTPDLLDGVPGEPTVANRYPYAANNPLGAVDPLGLRPYGDGDLNGSYGSSSGPDAWRNRFDPLLLGTALTAVDLAEHSARHRAVQVYFSTTVRPGTRMEVPIAGSGPNGGTGFADLVNGVEVWEVKPDRPWWTSGAGQAQLQRYLDNLPGIAGGRYSFAVPYGALELVVNHRNQDGMLYYYARYNRTRPVPQPEPVPVPVPVPAPAPAPVPVPAPQPAPSRGPDPGTVGGILAGVAAAGVAIWWGAKILSPACGPFAPLCAVAL
ncbi:MAG: RHS repeat domain-containing protein, partial [Actinomycetes bacterium]